MAKNALELANQARQGLLEAGARTALIYGAPKTGKTVFAATIAEAPQIKKVILYDLENGWESIVHAHYPDGERIISDAALEKITVVPIPDTSSNPIAAVTMLKVMSTRTRISICAEHGRVDCSRCKLADDSFLLDPSERDSSWVEIIDSGSQLAASFLALAKVKYDFKDLRQYYGIVAEFTADFLTMVQTSKSNIIVVTHTSVTENPEGKEVIFPNFGSRNQSAQCAKAFGSVIYRCIELNKLKGISTPTYRSDIVAGTRQDIALEKLKKGDMTALLAPATQSPSANQSESKANAKS